MSMTGVRGVRGYFTQPQLASFEGIGVVQKCDFFVAVKALR